LGILDRFRRAELKESPATVSPEVTEKKKNYKGRYEYKAPVLGFFNKLGRDEAQLQKYKIIYSQGGIVSQAIDAYAHYMLSNGYRIEGEDQGSVETVEEFCDEIDLESVISQGIKDALVYGCPFQEIVYGQGDASKTPLGVRSLPPNTLRINTDDRGVVQNYTQVVKIDSNKYMEYYFDKDEVITFNLLPESGNPYGISLIQRSWDDIMNDATIAQAITVAIKRHGFSKYQVKIGTEGEEVDQETIRGTDMELRGLESKNEIITPYDVEIINLDKDVLPDINAINEFSTSRNCISLGVPEIVMGLGRGSTEASSKVAMQSFYDRISNWQKIVVRPYNHSICDKLVGKKGKVKIVLNDANPEDENTKATWLAKIMLATPLDPYATFDKVFIQKQFDYNANMYYDSKNEIEGDKDDYYSQLNAQRAALPNPGDKASPAFGMGEKGKGSSEGGNNETK
jgi:hypothetical protein